MAERVRRAYVWHSISCEAFAPRQLDATFTFSPAQSLNTALDFFILLVCLGARQTSLIKTTEAIATPES